VAVSFDDVPDNSNDWTGDDSGAIFTPTATPVFTADGQTPAVGDSDAPYSNLKDAANGIITASTDNTCSHSIVYAKTNYLTGPRTTSGLGRPSAADGPLEIRPDPSIEDPRTIWHLGNDTGADSMRNGGFILIGHSSTGVISTSSASSGDNADPSGDSD
jgi:hypothetical protein